MTKYRLHINGLIIIIFSALTITVNSFLSGTGNLKPILQPSLLVHQPSSSCLSSTPSESTTNNPKLETNNNNNTSSAAQSWYKEKIRYYNSDGYKLAYRYYSNCPDKSNTSHDDQLSSSSLSSIPLLLIHPIGIGISSWFWKNLVNEFNNGTSTNIYAPDILGCGNSDIWDPNTKGLFFPLSYVRHIEELIVSIIKKPCIIMTQGAIAPVGIMLASRNPLYVKGLILSSPPSYNDLIQPIPQSILNRNYEFYNSNFGSIAFNLLEKRSCIEFFSNLFLFKKRNDNDNDDCQKNENSIEIWLHFIINDISISKREPIKVFNSGLLYHRSFQDEIDNIMQPVLIISGDSDTNTRVSGRMGYCNNIKASCNSIILDGRNILPWESSKETYKAISKYINKHLLYNK